MAPQAPFDLGHEVFRKPQVIEGLLEGLGGVLRLAAITCEALLGLQAAALSGFGLFFGASFGWGHGVLRCSVWDFCGCSLPKRTRHMPLASVRRRHCCVTRSQDFLLSFVTHVRYNIRPNGLANSHTVLLHAASA